MESMIVAPLEMVSPMFIALPVGWSVKYWLWELTLSSLSVHVHRSRIFTYRIVEELTKVCLAHRDKAEIRCMGSVGGKTPTEPNDLLL